MTIFVSKNYVDLVKGDLGRWQTRKEKEKEGHNKSQSACNICLCLYLEFATDTITTGIAMCKKFGDSDEWLGLVSKLFWGCLNKT